MSNENPADDDPMMGIGVDDFDMDPLQYNPPQNDSAVHNRPEGNDNNGNIISLQEKSSFYVMRDGLPSVEATLYNANWNRNLPVESLVKNASIRFKGRNSQDTYIPCSSSASILGNQFRFGFGGGDSGDGGDSKDPGKPTSDLFFEHCGGLEEQINFIKRAIIGPLTGELHKFRRFDLEPPKGVLFHGPPGTGKTRLAQALANEIQKAVGKNVHFIYRKGNDVASKYFGQSATNLRHVFQEATAQKPTVLFFDELDGLCPSRDKPYMSEAVTTVVTTMLGLLDELPKGEVFVIGATNRLDAIDPALRRPGRFDKYLEFLSPSEKGRLDILTIHTDQWKLKPEASVLQSLSKRTVGFSGADLSKLCQDTFDAALGRQFPNEGGANPKNIRLDNLQVEELDWHTALQKVKPSNSSVFGSAIYTPSPSKLVGDHVQSFIQRNIRSIQEMMNPRLPTSKNGKLGIKAFYVKSNSDEDIFSPLFRSHQLSQFPIYCISSATMSSVSSRHWPKQMDSIISQCLNCPQPSILYVQQVDEIWNCVQNAKMETALNMKQHLERLRDKPVILVASGSSSLNDLPSDNPFKQMFKMEESVWEVAPPTKEERLNLFTELFATIAVDKWSKDYKGLLAKVIPKLIDATERQGFVSVLNLYDALKQGLTAIGGDDETGADTVAKFLQILGAYETMGLLPS